MKTYTRLINKGIEQGMMQGKIDTAKQFKAQGVSIDIICKATGLSREDIKKLK